MTKFSSEYLSLADEFLRQYALTGCDKLSDILTKENLDIFQSQYTGGRVRDFPPLKTLSLFMHQVASENKSCRHALIADARDQIAMEREPNKTSNSGYCKARQRLTEESLMTLLTESGQNLDSASPESWLWFNRRVVIADGSTLSMPDTDENQEAYPQHGSQKKGLEIRS
ncbi:hypothetical protein [Endozoicomonas numazuensis]|uniref:hypothetical protein n=1 Tax=Endozoicomonas numazuensis TaxID=1137799 RepID=UPI0006907A5C|nr:hypothetical protein [Endozoicomonas numazuensis]